MCKFFKKLNTILFKITKYESSQYKKVDNIASIHGFKCKSLDD